MLSPSILQPTLASGMVVWLFINDTLSMSSSLFIREHELHQGYGAAYLRLRDAADADDRHAIVLRPFWVLVPILLLSGIDITPALLSVVPAILLLCC